jgi:uncharacterized C2H2 Zn-finger protein
MRCPKCGDVSNRNRYIDTVNGSVLYQCTRCGYIFEYSDQEESVMDKLKSASTTRLIRRIKDLEEENYMLARDLRLAESRIKELEELPSTTEPEYMSLSIVLQEALDQAQRGKGHERHSAGEPFESQEICQNTRAVGLGFPLGQARKKAREAKGIFERHGASKAVPDILGAMNYLAAAVIVMREKEEE